MSPGDDLWLDSWGYELHTNALATRYRDPLVLFFYQPGTAQELEQLSYQRLRAEYLMPSQLNQPPRLAEGFKVQSDWAPISYGRHSVNTDIQASEEGSDLPAASEAFWEKSAR